MRPAGPRRLPVDLVIRRSFAFAWESRAVLAGPYLIYMIVTILADSVGVYAARHGSEAVAVVITLADEVFALAFAVGVHRFVLSAEAPAGFRFFHFDRFLVQYVAATLLLAAVTFLAGMPLLAAIDGADSSAGAGGSVLIGLVLFLAAGIALARLALALPAAAIGVSAPLRTLWEATRGNGLRILAVVLVTLLPFLAIEGVLLRLSSSGGATQSGLMRELVLTVVAGAVSPLELIVISTMLSLCYDALVRGGGPPAQR
jgi:hypothetical protein